MKPDNLQLPSVQPSISSYKFQLPLGPHGHDGDGCHGGQCGHGGCGGQGGHGGHGGHGKKPENL